MSYRNASGAAVLVRAHRREHKPQPISVCPVWKKIIWFMHNNVLIFLAFQVNSFYSFFSLQQAFTRVRDLRYLELISSIEVRGHCRQWLFSPLVRCRNWHILLWRVFCSESASDCWRWVCRVKTAIGSGDSSLVMRLTLHRIKTGCGTSEAGFRKTGETFNIQLIIGGVLLCEQSCVQSTS